MTLEEKIDYRFQRPELLEQALTHKSFHNENLEQSTGHNERLEFLGDAVLDLCISDLLMSKNPDLAEGELSKRRAALVNEKALAELAKEFGFAERLRLGKGETQTGGAEKPRLLASAFEAFVGAFYLDAGFSLCHKFVIEVFEPVLGRWESGHSFEEDYKTRLQEVVQEKHKKTPHYEVNGDEGPDHEKIFYVSVKLEGKVLALGSGKSKKQAEQEAARKALESL